MATESGNPPEGLLDKATAARLALARAGTDTAVRLTIGALAVGQVGVLEAQVRSVAPARPYNRKRGGQGMLARVTLGDATGEVDLVLWDEETRMCTGGPLQSGSFVRIHGPLVKAGFRGGIELGLGSAEVAAMPAAEGPAKGIEGVLLMVGEARPVGSPPAVRFTCDLRLSVAGREVAVAAWDDAVKQAREAGVGARVRLPDAAPNPFLDGWWTAATLVAA